MKQNKLRIAIAAVLGVLAAVLIVLGALNIPQRTGAQGEQIISDLRNPSVSDENIISAADFVGRRNDCCVFYQ